MDTNEDTGQLKEVNQLQKFFCLLKDSHRE